MDFLACSGSEYKDTMSKDEQLEDTGLKVCSCSHAFSSINFPLFASFHSLFPSHPHSASTVNSPRHGYKVRLAAVGAAGAANCDCSYHAGHNTSSEGNRHLGSIESDDGADNVAEAKEATCVDETSFFSVQIFRFSI